MALVRYWLDKCVKEHQKCGSSVTSILPTRILDLGLDSSSKITRRELNSTQITQCRYICLSYCWGNPDFIMTTKDTLEAHKNGIELQYLPRTFRDAIEIARALEVQYLWIDALCIIQKDEDDWQFESGRMADIYRNSYLTVAATRASSTNDGCFTTPEQGVNIGSVMMRQINHFAKVETSKDSVYFPLLARAWSYQERLLAPRVLHFGHQELIWECLEKNMCECGQVYPAINQVSKSAFCNYISNFELTYYQSSPKIWRRLVIQYSSLKLSYRMDKLPALSGLAEEMQRKSKQEYMAGLWKETMVADMCWYRASPKNESMPSTPWLAPTWSWASVDGPVTYPSWLYLSRDVPYVIKQYAEVLNAKCTPAGSSITGQVKHGFVELHCSLIPARFNYNLGYFKSKTGFLELKFIFDRGNEREDDEGYYIIPMVSVYHDFCGLLVKLEEINVHIRIGLATTYYGTSDRFFSILEEYRKQYKKQKVKVIYSNLIIG